MHDFMLVCFGIAGLMGLTFLFAWLVAICFAMIADVLSTIFAIAQAVFWEVWQRFRQ